MNVLEQILNIISYDDKDEDEKLLAIKKVVNDNINYLHDLIRLKEMVTEDVLAKIFDINLDAVSTEEYVKILDLKPIISYERNE